MTAKLTQIWYIINKVLTNINIFLAIVLFQVGDPEKAKDKKIPLVTNMILLVILISIPIYFIVSYSNEGSQTAIVSSRSKYYSNLTI